MTTLKTTPDQIKDPSQESLWRLRWRLRLKSFRNNWALFVENPIGLIGLGVILFFALLAVGHPVLMATVWEKNVYDPIRGFDNEIEFHPSAPSARHILGTDPTGRDILSQLMYSTQTEFLLGVMAAFVTIVIATTLGALAAYYGGIVDTLLMRLADLVIMIPLLPILIVLSALRSDFGMLQLALVLGVLIGFGTTMVVIKSQGLAIKVKPYIEAARIAGGSDRHIILKHMIPNLMPIALLYMMFTVTTAIAIEAVLSFFGLLAIPMSWGIMINTTQNFGYILRFDTWYLLFPASLAITFLCAAFYLVGRALDEVINPRLRTR